MKIQKADCGLALGQLRLAYSLPFTIALTRHRRTPKTPAHSRLQMKTDSFAHVRSAGIGFFAFLLVVMLDFNQTALAQTQPAPNPAWTPPPEKSEYVPRTELFDAALSYNYINAPDQEDVKDLHGLDTNLFFNATPWLAFGGDFMAGFGNNTSRDFADIEVVDVTRFVYMGGPRLSLRPRERVRLFLQAVFGGAHEDTRTTVTGPNHFGVIRDSSESTWAFDASIGLDWRLADQLSWRVLQVGYLGTNFSSTSSNDWQDNWRVSTGVVWSFGGRAPLANAK